MNNEEYNQIVGEAYENYMSNWPKKIPRIGPCTIEEFINKCKTDNEFSKTWELKIEERRCTLDNGEFIKEINVYHIPKKSVEYIETKFILLPTGNIKVNNVTFGCMYNCEDVCTGECNQEKISVIDESEKDLYSDIEDLIIRWSNDGTKTAGELTRRIMSLLKNQKKI